MNSKEYFFDEVIKEAVNGSSGLVRVLELGCGTASYVPAMIQKYSQLEYVGVEPILASFEKATEILAHVPRTKISSQLAYDSVGDIADESFDIVISFSVLEHVKHLDKFMALSARYVKKGGIMVHRYDLGHALYPLTLKDKIHVTIGNVLPSVLPERKFVRYVPMSEVSGHYKQLLGTEPYRYTYHQMPNHKSLTKALIKEAGNDNAMQDVYAWEFTHAKDFGAIGLPLREKLFPTIAVWGRKE